MQEPAILRRNAHKRGRPENILHCCLNNASAYHTLTITSPLPQVALTDRNSLLHISAAIGVTPHSSLPSFSGRAVVYIGKRQPVRLVRPMLRASYYNYSTSIGRLQELVKKETCTILANPTIRTDSSNELPHVLDSVTAW